MNKRFSLFELIAILFLCVCTSACTGVSSMPVTIAGNVAVPESNIYQDIVEVQSQDCSLETKTEGDSFYFRAPCRKGMFLFYSFHLFRGGPQDPGAMIFYISAQSIDSADWRKLDQGISWVALFGDTDQQLMHDEICRAIKGDEANSIPSRQPIGSTLLSVLKQNPCR